MSYVLVGGVQLSRKCLYELAMHRFDIKLVIGYPPDLKHKSGYVSMKDICIDFDLPLIETYNLDDPAVVAAIKGSGAQLMVVTGWSRLIKRHVLDACPLGAVGLHPTKLPEGRGRAPIPWTILKGLKETAVTLFHIGEYVDDGDIIAQEPIFPTDKTNATRLYNHVSWLSAKLLIEYLPEVLAGTAPRIPQDESKATYWPKRKPEDGLIDWSKPPEEIDRLIRALTHPYPGAFAYINGKKITIWEATVEKEP